jgi:DNA-binding CsgD family transcriptional regulator
VKPIYRSRKLGAAKNALTIGADGLYKFGDKELIGIAYSKIGKIESLEGRYYKALAIYKKAFEDLLTVESAHVIRVGGEYITLLNEGEKYNEALKVIAIIDQLKLFSTANMKDKMVYKNAAADTYSGTNNYKDAIREYQHTIAIKDSIAEREKKNAVQEIQAKYQTELQREKNISLESKNKTLEEIMSAEQKLILLYIIISIVIIGFILVYLRSSRLKNKLQKEALKAIEIENELIKQQRIHELELLRQQKDTIDEKQRELTSTALRMANYQDNINNIINKCEAGEFTKISEIKKELQYLIKQKDYWKQFETRFNNLHPEFNNALTNKFAKLTKNDLEFCSLLKLNLSNKEIASLLQISHESVITKKYRIKKKMEITEDAEFEKLMSEM